MDCWTVLFFKMVGCEWFVWVWYWYNEYWMDRSNVLYEYGLTEKEDYWLLLVGSSFECRRDWIAINNWRLLRDDDGIDWQLKDYVCCSATFISSLNITEQSICFWFFDYWNSFSSMSCCTSTIIQIFMDLQKKIVPVG